MRSSLMLVNPDGEPNMLLLPEGGVYVWMEKKGTREGDKNGYGFLWNYKIKL